MASDCTASRSGFPPKADADVSVEGAADVPIWETADAQTRAVLDQGGSLAVAEMAGDPIVAGWVAVVVERNDRLRAPLPCLPETEGADRAVAAGDDPRVGELGLDLGPAVDVEATVAGGLGDGLALDRHPRGVLDHGDRVIPRPGCPRVEELA